MDISTFILGLLFCGASGAVDRNPTTLRMATVLVLYTIGLGLLIESVGGMQK